MDYKEYPFWFPEEPEEPEELMSELRYSSNIIIFFLIIAVILSCGTPCDSIPVLQQRLAKIDTEMSQAQIALYIEQNTDPKNESMIRYLEGRLERLSSAYLKAEKDLDNAIDACNEFNNEKD